MIVIDFPQSFKTHPFSLLNNANLGDEQGDLGDELEAYGSE